MQVNKAVEYSTKALETQIFESGITTIRGSKDMKIKLSWRIVLQARDAYECIAMRRIENNPHYVSIDNEN